MTWVQLMEAVKRRLWSNSESLLLVRPAGKLPDESKRKPCDGVFRPVTEKNIQDCGAFEDASVYVPIYREMLKAGDYVHFGYIQGKCAFRHCLKKSGSFDLGGGTTRTLSSGEVYIHYGYCAPEHRGHGLHAESIYRFCMDHLNDTIYTLVKETNRSSLHGCARNGFEVKSRLFEKNRFFLRQLHEVPVGLKESEEILKR